MTPREQIEGKRDELVQLCHELGIPELTVHFIGGEGWPDAEFVADLDHSRSTGYADRFFGLEEGLLRIFCRRIDILEKQMFVPQTKAIPLATVELLHAS